MNDKELDYKIKNDSLSNNDAWKYLADIYFDNQYLSRPGNPVYPPMIVSEIVMRLGDYLFPATAAPKN